MMGLFSLPVSAEPVTDLYKTVVPVSNQGAGERLRAMRVGLGRVLVKVTGDSQVLSNINTTETFSNAERYVTEYGYVHYQDPLEKRLSSEPGTGMSLSFDEASINRLLRQNQLQVWPSDRPGLLVWLVIDDSVNGKNFVSSEMIPSAVDTLGALMGDRGAPLISPLLDLQDRQILSPESAWNFNQVALAAATERYNTESWMALRFYKSSTGQWRGARLLNLNGDDDLRSIVANSLPELMSKVVPEVVDSLASRYAYIPKSINEELLVQVENINDYKTFDQATTYFASLEVVHRLTVDYVDADRVGLRLFVEGEVPLLLDTLRRDKRMTKMDDMSTPILTSEIAVPSSEAAASSEANEPSAETNLPTPNVPSSIKSYRFRWGGQ
ncbi:MAG: DUF2066 domain-containing protein [Porticoccus sp.]